jgi:hypothetical protein
MPGFWLELQNWSRSQKKKNELKVRIVELEQTTKLSQTENAELKNEIAKLKRAVKNIEKQKTKMLNYFRNYGKN